MNFEKVKPAENIFRRAEMIDIPIIKKLLEENLGKNLSEEEKKDGFVTFEPTENELSELINDTGIFINLKGNELKGYLITASKELSKNIPFFNEMIENMESIEYDGKKIGDYNYGLLAQINIAKKYRGGTTFFRLHTYAQTALNEQGFELGIGEIADTNEKSLAVHRNLSDIGTYTAKDGLVWHVVVADLRED
jgi:hypothetical protein